MKTIFKLLCGLVIGGLIGLLIGGLLVVLFTDTTFIEYVNKFYSIDAGEGIYVFAVAIVACIISIAILIPIHELGHLVCGLLTGYKFVSYRIFNYTIIREDEKTRIKKFSLPGTGGQCLLTAPDLPLEDIPTRWYNFGGVLANIVVLLIVLPLFLLDLNPFVAEALGVFAFIDGVMILINGIPMQAGGVGNDGFNMLLLKRSIKSKLGMVNQLRANALIQGGVRPKDMPDSLFTNPKQIDYKNTLEVTLPLMHASRLIDMMEYEDALIEMEALYEHKEDIMQLYQREISCELAFLYLRTGKIEKADKILNKDLRKYIDTYRKVMSSKERLLVAISFFLDNDKAKACELYERFRSRLDEYLFQGEAKSDLALIEDFLGNS